MDQFKFIAENYVPVLYKYDIKNTMKMLDQKKAKQMRAEGKVPVLQYLNPAMDFGAISEKMYEKIQKYKTTNPDKKLRPETEGEEAEGANSKMLSARSFEKLCNFKYFYSLMQPGESVGIIASQAIGEPSTQMTLNTFHLAGHGGVNVTLGVPRLREILMTAGQKIKTPSMILLPLPGTKKEAMQQVVNLLKRVRLQEVVRDVEVVHNIEQDSAKGLAAHAYHIRIDLENLAAITATFDVSYDTIKQLFKDQFVPQLVTIISKELKKAKEVGQRQANDIQVRTAAEHKAAQANASEEDEVAPKQQAKKEKDEVGDIEGYEGATQLNKKHENADYDEDDKEEPAVPLEVDSLQKVMEEEEKAAVALTAGKNDKDTKKSRKVSNVDANIDYDKEKEGQIEIVLTFPLECKKILMLEYVAIHNTSLEQYRRSWDR